MKRKSTKTDTELILEKISELSIQVGKLNARIDELGTWVYELNTHITHLSDGQDILREGQSGLKSETKVIRQRTVSIDSKFDKLFNFLDKEVMKDRRRTTRLEETVGISNNEY